MQVFPVIADDPLGFSETELSVVREGYCTLNWNALPSAAEYHVEAFDEAGNVIATTQVPAVVLVRQWSLQLAWHRRLHNASLATLRDRYPRIMTLQQVMRLITPLTHIDTGKLVDSALAGKP